ncbi:MAG: Ig-like domain-containing protein [Flavobacteriales bacterium]|nr:Ig-like domain-containing protein [Flavobacteriales bacterium]
MRRELWSVLAVLLLSACAQVREITGGDKDVAGPKLVGAVPANYTTHFTNDRILLRFDEHVQLEPGRDRLLVSPPLDEPPTVRVVRASEVEIRLNAPLRPRTTYTFSLDGAVKDLTEGNSAAGLDYVISTGDALDSLAIVGRVIDAFGAASVNGALVMVHDASDTLSFKNSRPLYATRTDAAGSFALRHLPAGAYRLSALKDQNANYRYDLPNEEIAFAQEPVHAVADSAMAPITLRSFLEKSAVQAIREAVVTEDAAWRIVLARPAERIALNDIARVGGSLTWTAEWSAARDTVLLWPSDTTALAQGRYAFNTEEGILDTLRYRPMRKMPFNTKLELSTEEEGKDMLVRVRTSRPIASLDQERVGWVVDSIAASFTIEQDPVDRRAFSMRAALAAGAKATLMFLPKAVRDIYGGYNDTLRIGIGRAAEKRTGILRVTLADSASAHGPMLLQLLDAQRLVVRSAVSVTSAPVVWQGIAPGNHGLRLIEDANANGRWDTGEWSSGLQPERVWYYNEPLNVRAAWDLGITWELAR